MEAGPIGDLTAKTGSSFCLVVFFLFFFFFIFFYLCELNLGYRFNFTYQETVSSLDKALSGPSGGGRLAWRLEACAILWSFGSLSGSCPWQQPSCQPLMAEGSVSMSDPKHPNFLKNILNLK